jgi:predicted DNA-binding transcriptional regulator AlpA
MNSEREVWNPMQHPLTHKTVPEFFGRRYLRADELIDIGIVTNRTTLDRLVRDGKFPAPLRLNTKTVIWDTMEVAALLEQRRNQRESTAE